MSDWVNILQLSARAESFTPVSKEELTTLRDWAQLPLPQAYEDFLAFSNGLDVYSPVVFSAAQVIKHNQQALPEDAAELYMAFDSIFFFGADADGDLFFFRRLRNEIDGSVYVWRHEDDSRIHVAFDLLGFLRKYLSGEYDAWKF